MVFAPTPRLTITVEERGGQPDIHLHAGGQGVWQARMVRSLGVPVTVCTVLGGEIGRVLEPLLAEEGVELRVVWGTSRSSGYVHDRRGGSRVDIAEVPGDPLDRHELDELYGLALAEGLRAEVCILAGGGPAVPPGAYRRLAHDLGRNGCQPMADLTGDYLAAALAGGLRFVKVSHEELISDGRAADDSEDELVRAVFRLRDDGAQAAVVSRADQPALALLDDAVFEVTGPALQPADPRGAGDSMTAGVAAVLARGGDLATAVRTGAAAGALNVTRHGLGTGRAGQIAQLVDRVRLTAVRKGPEQLPAGQRATGIGEKAIATPDELAERARPR
jgi:1-phosphofructokinase